MQHPSGLSEDELGALIEHLRTRRFMWSVNNPIEGHLILPGLSDVECRTIEEKYDFRFPPDLRAFLQFALPANYGFPNWRDTPEDAIRGWLGAPADGMCFDVEHGFWLPEWGPRPESDEDACAIARGHVATAPRLIPIFAHRFMPDRPHEAGNPVYSVHQTDIIYYGSTLADYFHNEFYRDVGPPRRSGPLPWRMSREPKRIEFWSRIIDDRGDLWDHEFERRVSERNQAEMPSSPATHAEHSTEPHPPDSVP